MLATVDGLWAGKAGPAPTLQEAPAAPGWTTDVWALLYPEADSTVEAVPTSLTLRLAKGFFSHSLAHDVTYPVRKS